MRAFALLLILANLGFLGWSRLIDVRSPDRTGAVRAGLAAPPRLLLPSEAASTEPALAAAPAEEDGPGGVTADTEGVATGLPPAGPLSASDIEGLSCVSVGPFRDLAEAVQASAVLQAAGFFSRQRTEEGEVWLGYWVSIQDLSGPEAALEALAVLGRGGITDAYVLPGTQAASIVSAGVFADASRARRRVEDIAALGLAAGISDRTRAGAVHWVDVDLPAPGEMFDPSLLQAQPGRIVRQELRPCPQAAPETVPGAADPVAPPPG